jgi:hypothetical protein
MKHELALAVVVAAAIGTVGVTVAIGSRVKEPTVVANPYETGLHHAEAVAALGSGKEAPADAPTAIPACDLAAGSCSQATGPFVVRLELGPRPLRTLVELSAAVELRWKGAPVDGAQVELSLEMRGMSMGENRRALAPVGGGRYAGKAVLVSCPSGRKDWLATVNISGRSVAVARFELTAAD